MKAAASRLWSMVLWVLSATTIGLAIWHGLHAVTALGEWRRWRTSDPSLADFFLTELEIELAFAVACLLAACLLAFVARWSRPYRRSDEHARPD